MILDTDRLRLRPYVIDDAPAALALYGDPEVTRYIGGVTTEDLAQMREQLAARIARCDAYPDGLGAWAAVDPDGGLVGTGLLKPLPDANGVSTQDIEVGWHLARTHWGQGYATEIGARLIQYGFTDLGLARIHAVVEPANAASKRVALRLGLVHHGRTERYYGGVSLDHFSSPASSAGSRSPAPG